MLKIFTPYLLIAFVLLLAACSRSAYKSEQKDLSTLIKRLTKRGSDDRVLADIHSVYDPALQKAQQNISNYQYDAAPQKWDKIIGEMQNMQRMYEIINTNQYAMRMINPVNFYRNIAETKDTAAADYYAYANSFFERSGRDNSRQAYEAYANALNYVPNYKDARQKMQEAFNRSIIYVLINQVQYDGYGFNNNWNWNNYNNRDQMMQNQIIRDLGGRANKNTPAYFFNEWDLRRENRGPDMVVDLVWRNMRFDQPRDRTRNYNRSKQIEVGRDTANKPIYQTVTATVYVTERYLEANADMNLIFTDAENRSQIDWQTIPASFRESVEFASYSGDRRALDENDWRVINRNQNQPLPNRDEVFDRMMRNIYSNMLNHIRRVTEW
jgi:tetratricopeptide (TPR) repeat protein